jgi:hypothetical protein
MVEAFVQSFWALSTTHEKVEALNQMTSFEWDESTLMEFIITLIDAEKELLRVVISQFPTLSKFLSAAQRQGFVATTI